ncbi:MAG TPA: hypothetical protein VIW01_02580, partial [Dehalococcoidia bacterium]
MALGLLFPAFGPQSRQADAGFTSGFFWRASEPWSAGLPGPVDGGGALWYEPSFDSSSWSSISLPDVNSIGANPGYDRFYRAVVFVASPATFDHIAFQSDDGLWLYVNGTFLDSWGNGGCTNNPPGSCATNQNVPPIDIRPYLQAGSNIVAVRLNNAAGPTSYFDLNTAPEPTPSPTP